jgi:hypothetical protein
MNAKIAPFLAASVTVFLSAMPVRAQESLLPPGTIVRLRTRTNERLTGRVGTFDCDTLTLFVEGRAEAVRLASREVDRIEVNGGRSHGQGLRDGALSGLAIGALTGTVLAISMMSSGDSFSRAIGRAEALPVILWTSAFATGIGGAVGGIIGEDRWDRTDATSLRVGSGPRRDRFGAAVSISFR